MRLGIKGKQVLGVTSIVGDGRRRAEPFVLGGAGARQPRGEPGARGAGRGRPVPPRAAGRGAPTPIRYRRSARDPGLRSILEASLYSKNVTFAAIVDVNGLAVAHADPSLEGQPAAGGGSHSAGRRSPLSQLLAIYSPTRDRTSNSEPLLLGDTEFGSMRIGVSTLLIRQDLDVAAPGACRWRSARWASSVLVATLLSQLFLRPIHVIRSGLTRLGRASSASS